VTHAGSFLSFSFTVSLANLVDLDLSGNDHLDVGALSQWLNQSSVISLDFFNQSFWNDPGKLSFLMKSTTKLMHLRFPYFLLSLFIWELVSDYSAW